MSGNDDGGFGVPPLVGGGGSSGEEESRYRPVVTDFGLDLEDMQELHPVEPCELGALDWATLAARAAVLLAFAVAYVLVLVNVCRGTRLKNWRLYAVASACVAAWLAAGAYQDHVDECFAHLVHVVPQRVSIYW